MFSLASPNHESQLTIVKWFIESGWRVLISGIWCHWIPFSHWYLAFGLVDVETIFIINHNDYSEQFKLTIVRGCIMSIVMKLGAKYIFVRCPQLQIFCSLVGNFPFLLVVDTFYSQKWQTSYTNSFIYWKREVSSQLRLLNRKQFTNEIKWNKSRNTEMYPKWPSDLSDWRAHCKFALAHSHTHTHTHKFNRLIPEC